MDWCHPQLVGKRGCVKACIVHKQSSHLPVIVMDANVHSFQSARVWLHNPCSPGLPISTTTVSISSSRGERLNPGQQR